jgi:membrane protein implicated in regulation of membrane protease activity
VKEILYSKEVIWFIIGLVLFLLEFIFPGLVLLFFGVGAWITSIAAYLFDFSLDTQLIIFIISSLLSLAALRKLLKEKYMNKSNKDSDDSLEIEFVGKVALALSSFKSGEAGKVEFKGSTWTAISDFAIIQGERVEITEINSIKLTVKPLNQSL